jgi:hypothetical protein
MDFSNSDVKAGDVIGTVELIDDLAEDKHSSSSCAQVQGQPQPLADISEAGDTDHKSN